MAAPYASRARARSRSLPSTEPASTWARHPTSVVAARPDRRRQGVERFVGIVVVLQVEEGRGARELIGERKRPGLIGGEIGRPFPCATTARMRRDSGTSASARRSKSSARVTADEVGASTMTRRVSRGRPSRPGTSRVRLEDGVGHRQNDFDPARRVTRFGEVLLPDLER